MDDSNSQRFASGYFSKSKLTLALCEFASVNFEPCIQDGNLGACSLANISRRVLGTAVNPDTFRIGVDGQIRFESGYAWTWKFLNPERKVADFKISEYVRTGPKQSPHERKYKTVFDSGFHDVDSAFQVMNCGFFVS